MRVISCRLENFASYKNVEFTFDNQGLCLIQGATGSGKSTLCDAIPWVLFGRTAKDGAVDEVRSWNTDEPTKGHLILHLNDNITIEVTRIRGRGSNDLYYNLYDHALFNPGHVIPNPRGKDLLDTQRLINGHLGLDLQTYLAGAYFHEFSPSASFFTATAKNRRALCDQLVDLSLAKTLDQNLKADIKDLITIKNTVDQDIRSQTTILNTLQTYRMQLDDTATKDPTVARIKNDIKIATSYMIPEAYIIKEQTKLDEACKLISKEKCELCGNILESDLIADLHGQQHDLNSKIQDNKRLKYQVRQLEASLKDKEEFDKSWRMRDLTGDINKSNSLLELLRDKQQALNISISDLELLEELIATLRATTITNTIQQLQDNTNLLLSNHFDAEIKVLFEVADADKLDVVIMKDGNQAVFTQLSKGQRQLLKLCFGISVMKAVSNHKGITFNCIFLDEAFDGLSEELKIKAYGLLETLRLDYSSIFVVEHSQELKALFTNQKTVQLINGHSEISE